MADQNNTSASRYELEAVNASKSNLIIARRILWAATSKERRKGLLGRTEISPDEGLYITPCEWVHTFGMKFPIDIAFLAANGCILAIHHSLKPNRLSKLIFRADGVLELAPGKLSQTGTAIGDIIQFREASQTT